MADNIIRLTSEIELEALQVETFINTTASVTKITDQSTLRGIIRGNSKVAKKSLKDIALAVSHLFPDSSFDTTLDKVAEIHGIAPRLAAAQSSTWIRVVGDPGTVYTAGVQTVSDNKGNIFDLEDSVTLDNFGFAYTPVRSQQSGKSSNVDPYTLINISPAPSGHVAVINEYGATGGRDVETDDIFRQRIKEGPDILARGTLSYLTQVFIKINPNVLRVTYNGVDVNGKVKLSVLTVNGIDFNDNELQTLLEEGGQYFSLTELSPIGTQSYGVELSNVTYCPIDVTFRMSLFSGFDFTSVVKDIQKNFSKLVDFRFWDGTQQSIEWTDLLNIIKNTKGVKFSPDNFFIPNVNIGVPRGQFPRFRGFVVYDLEGNIMIDQEGVISDVFYPNEVIENFNLSVL